jgi:predicted ribosomally synthesized peptide with nif11-like leader
MSKVREFYEALSKDEAMQERAKGLKAGDWTTEEAATEAVVAFAKGEGYEFTAGELKDASKELSDQDLAAAAGGAKDWSKECVLGGRVGDCSCTFTGQSILNGGLFWCTLLGW